MLKLNEQAFLRAPHATLARVLEAGCFNETRVIFFGRMRLVLGHPEIQDVLKDGDRFAVDARNAGHSSPFGLRFLPGSMKVLAENLLSLDDPRHRQLRQMVDEPFRRTAIEAQAPAIRALADRLIDEMISRGDSDFVEAFCRQLPLQVIVELLGFSDEVRPQFQSVMKRIGGAASPLQMIRAIFRLKPLQEALRVEFERVRAAPRPGLLSELVHATADGEGMSDNELLSMVFVLFVAGHETTTHLLSTSLFTLLTHDGAAARYVAGDDTARSIAVDELVRYCAPVQMTKPRHARFDMEFHGQELKQGERVMALLSAGNLDPRVFDNPLELDLGRRPNRHLGWGGGPHMCLGLHLAKAETQLGLDALFERFPDVSLDTPADRLKWIARTGLRGLHTLPLKLH
ncbi:MAG: cytochrome P450 [Pseudomonadota bacterium]|nr:cytochrome P450 [Pseudomonadota bacterium]